jgi:hypothetical protein
VERRQLKKRLGNGSALVVEAEKKWKQGLQEDK